jgi:hypothetical protein
MGPEFIVATISADFIDVLPAEHLEYSVTELTKKIKAIDSRIQRVFIEAEHREDHQMGSS